MYNGVWMALLSALIGAIIFLGVAVPKDTLHIYDPTENKYQAVGNVPQLLVWIAGGTNLLERTLLELTETSGSPLAFSKQGGAKGVRTLNYLMLTGGFSPSGDPTLGNSVQRYITDCVELATSLGSMPIEELMRGGDKLFDILGDSSIATTTNTTTLFTSSAPSGTGATCSAAWASISARLTSAASHSTVSSKSGFYPTMKQACQESGYDLAPMLSLPNAADFAYTQCWANADALLNTSNGSWRIDNFLIETFLLNNFWAAMALDNPSIMSEKNKSITYMAQFTEFMDGLAAKRGVMVAVLVMLFPFVMLFAVGGWLSVPRIIFPCLYSSPFGVAYMLP